ncbi:MAG: HAD-IIA family hydrolase [Bacilli bacterium]|jgi:HAD superfamily hydrolase (TIGR01450 family)
MNTKPASALNDKKVFLLDMDGTLYNEERLFPDVGAFLNHLKMKKIGYYFLTNNSSKSSRDYVEKLNRLGIKATSKQIIISTHIAAHYLTRVYGNRKIYAVGTRSMVKELARLGVNVTTEEEPGIAAIVVGNDNELDYRKLTSASRLLTAGADFIATNVDKACPVSFGYVPDCGAICEMLTHATGKKPLYMGKPKAEIVNYVRDLTKAGGKDVVMVGDRLYTDMLMAVKRNMTSVCLLSGEATETAISKFPYTIDYVFKDISSLLRAMKGKL